MNAIKTQHAIGALVGSAVGDALGAPFEFKQPGLYRSTYPAPVLGGIGEMRGGGGFNWKPGEFTDDTQMAIALAESLIANDGFDAADLMVLDILPAAARERWAPLLAPDWQPDLGRNNGTAWTCLAEAIWAVRHAATFEDAVVNAVDLGRDADTVACVAGGPARVHDAFPIYAANRAGAEAAPRDWRVISLCRVGEAFTARTVRRQVFVVDKAEPQHNENLPAVLADIVDTIDALIAEDASQPILVHCHGGRSRTAFVLKGWAMRRFGWTEERAHAWLEETWPRIDRANGRFVEVLHNEW